MTTKTTIFFAEMCEEQNREAQREMTESLEADRAEWAARRRGNARRLELQEKRDDRELSTPSARARFQAREAEVFGDEIKAAWREAMADAQPAQDFSTWRDRRAEDDAAPDEGHDDLIRQARDGARPEEADEAWMRNEIAETEARS